MSDLIFLLVTVAFFAVATGFVHVCDRIVGRTETASGTAAPSAVSAAPAPIGTDA